MTLEEIDAAFREIKNPSRRLQNDKADLAAMKTLQTSLARLDETDGVKKLSGEIFMAIQSLEGSISMEEHARFMSRPLHER